MPGHYEVSLTTYDQNGCQFTIEDYNNYSISDNSFGFDYGLSCQDNLFSFTDTSLSGTEWLWNFGDGTIDSVQNPIHQYALPGLYLVQFTVSSGGCNQTVNSIVSSAFCLPAEAVLSTAADPNQSPADSSILIINTGSDSLNYHCAPYTINVSSPFNNTISILWDFGDGNSSTELTPSHTYNSAGVYDLNITVTTNDSIYHIISPEYLWLDAGASDYNFNQVNICGGGQLSISILIAFCLNHICGILGTGTKAQTSFLLIFTATLAFIHHRCKPRIKMDVPLPLLNLYQLTYQTLYSITPLYFA